MDSTAAASGKDAEVSEILQPESLPENDAASAPQESSSPPAPSSHANQLEESQSVEVPEESQSVEMPKESQWVDVPQEGPPVEVPEEGPWAEVSDEGPLVDSYLRGSRNGRYSSRPVPATPRNSQRTASASSVATIRTADVFYKRKAPIIINPLLPPRPCRDMLRRYKVPGNNLSIVPGPARHRLAEERERYRQFRSECPKLDYWVNPAAVTPMPVRPNPHTRASSKKDKRNQESTWAQVEEKLKDYRDHLMAEEIGYETLVGNLLYIDIPGGRDINRSWQNFLSEDTMEWGFPYYKGSRDRPRVNNREPYLAHQLKEKLWRYPKTRIFHSTVDES